jgi:hypothetical protein
MRAAGFWGMSLVIAIILMVVRLMTSPDVAVYLLGLGLGVLLIPLIAVVVGWFANRPMARIRTVSPGAWVHFIEARIQHATQT